MRLKNGGIIHVATVIEEDLRDRDTNLTKPQRIGLADIASSILTCRNVNTSELANVLPRKVNSDEERYRYINRWLANDKITPHRVMQGFVPEMLELLGENDQTVILMMDQSKISDGMECLMISARLGMRATAIGWKVVQTKGEIGFNEQKELLEKVAKMIPQGINVLLSADRFYGTANLIKWCQDQKWQYRIRLKSNLILQHQGGELATGELQKLGLHAIEDAELNKTGVKTNIGVLHEQGHKEPWIIAMDCKPNKGRTLDYGMRWGIEALFSDMKTRGFGITKTRLKNPKRIERLILVLAIACFWAISTGMQPREAKKYVSKKKKQEVLSHFSKGV